MGTLTGHLLTLSETLLADIAFGKGIEQELAKLGLRLIRLENAEPLADRLAKYTIDNELKDLAQRVGKTDSVGFGTFDAFDVS